MKRVARAAILVVVAICVLVVLVCALVWMIVGPPAVIILG
jgi:hypothetical protein